MVETVVVESLGQLPKNLRTKVFGDIALVIDLADGLGDLREFLVKQQENPPLNSVGQQKVV